MSTCPSCPSVLSHILQDSPHL
ncbi:hypothetical protein E2C01_094150 [Portunus trituberculatus]|uniref:Uncharacterized protein n=1 Tax=Portunus trituberculatus TaxID=210409 RepID=A0A5B7JVE4_PORTR|nr:hypothetical protein [Portunus trituberculatus]